MNGDLEYLIGRARTLATELDPRDDRTPEQLAYWAGQARYVLGQLAEVAGQAAAVARVNARGSDPAAIAEAEGDFGPAGIMAGLASCGHPADEDGECSCSYWPERAPLYLTGAPDRIEAQRRYTDA